MSDRVGYCWQCGEALARGVNATFTDPIGNVRRVHKVCLKTLNEQRTVTAQPMHEAIGFGAYSSKKETP